MSKSFKRQFLNMREKAKGNHPMRFLFTVSPLSASDIPRDIENVVFVWQRGAKIQESKVQEVDRSKGVVQFEEGTMLKQTTTCYRADDTWQPKPYKLKLQSVQTMKNGEDKTKTIGKYEVDFSVFCAMGLTGGEEEIEVNFKPRGKLRAVIASQWLKDFDMTNAQDIMSEMPYGQSFTQSMKSFTTDHDWEVLDFAPAGARENNNNNNQLRSLQEQQIDTRNFDQITPQSSFADKSIQEAQAKAAEALSKEDEEQLNEEPKMVPTLSRRAVTLPSPPKTKFQTPDLAPAPAPSPTPVPTPTPAPPAYTNPFAPTPAPPAQTNPFAATPPAQTNPFAPTPSVNSNPFDVPPPVTPTPQKKNSPPTPAKTGISTSKKTYEQEKEAVETPVSQNGLVGAKPKVAPSPRVGQRVFASPETIPEHTPEQQRQEQSQPQLPQKQVLELLPSPQPQPQPQQPSAPKKQVLELLPTPKWKKGDNSRTTTPTPTPQTPTPTPTPTPQTPKDPNEKSSKFVWFKKPKSEKTVQQELDYISKQENVETLRQKAMEILGQLEKENEVGQKTKFYIESLKNCLSDLEQSDSGILERMSGLQLQISENKQIDVVYQLAQTKAQLADAHYQILYLRGEVQKERARNRAILNKFTAQQTERDILLTKKKRSLSIRVLNSFRSARFLPQEEEL